MREGLKTHDNGKTQNLRGGEDGIRTHDLGKHMEHLIKIYFQQSFVFVVGLLSFLLFSCRVEFRTGCLAEELVVYLRRSNGRYSPLFRVAFERFGPILYANCMQIMKKAPTHFCVSA